MPLEGVAMIAWNTTSSFQLRRGTVCVRDLERLLWPCSPQPIMSLVPSWSLVKILVLLFLFVLISISQLLILLPFRLQDVLSIPMQIPQHRVHSAMLSSISLIANHRRWLWPFSLPVIGLRVHLQYTLLMCTHTKAVLRGEIYSKETWNLKPLRAQCMSNLARWEFQAIQWYKLEQDIQHRIFYVKRLQCHLPLHLWYASRKTSHKDIPAITPLLWQMQMEAFTWSRTK